jgi:hypothetical protein
VMWSRSDGAGYALAGEPERARQALTAISATGRQALGRDAAAARRAAVRRPVRRPGPRSPGLTSCGTCWSRPGRQAGRLTVHAGGRAAAAARGRRTGRLPGGPGVADQRAGSTAGSAPRCACCSPVHAERAARPGDRRRAGRGRGADDGAGLGLTGMRERVTVLRRHAGGRAAGDGGYRVSATLPLDPDAAAASGGRRPATTGGSRAGRGP